MCLVLRIVSLVPFLCIGQTGGYSLIRWNTLSSSERIGLKRKGVSGLCERDAALSANPAMAG